MNVSESLPERPTTRMPDAFGILFLVILLAAVLTYLVPPGQYEKVNTTLANGETKLLIDPDSFQYSANQPIGIALFSGSDKHVGLLNFAFEGLVSGTRGSSAIGVVAFILIIGGAFGIIVQSQAINNGVMALISRTHKSDKFLIPFLFVLFSLGGAIFGMGEEAIAFCVVLVPVMRALGYDAMTAVLTTYLATQIGFATSWMNPFSVAIAQGIAEVPVMSGYEFRAIMWGCFTLVGLIFTMRYAAMVKHARSLTFTQGQEVNVRNNGHVQFNRNALTLCDLLVLLVLAGGIGWVIWGVTLHQYFIPQIASQFFAMGIITGVIACLAGRMNINDVSEAFVSGARELLPAALIVGMAKGIVIVLGGEDVTQPSVFNTLLHYTSGAMDSASATTSAVLMLLFQSVFNFFVASGSGQAAITMPLMAPLSDLVGVSRQIAVLAFQLGDGLSNLVVPTSASLMGCLGVAKVPWTLWLKTVWRFALLIFLLAAVTVAMAVMTGFY